MRWLRLYTDVINDAKISKLPDGLFRFWIGILIIARKNEGTLPASDEIAFLLRTSSRKAKTNLESLVSVGLIDHTPDGMRPHKWDHWQPQSDDQRGRQKRHRDSKRNVAANVTETPQSRADSDSEESESRAADAANRSHSIGIIKTSLPPDFQLTPARLRYSADQGIDHVRTERTFEKFKNHHRSNGTLSADWDAAWRSWVGREDQYSTAKDIRNRIDDRL